MAMRLINDDLSYGQSNEWHNNDVINQKGILSCVILSVNNSIIVLFSKQAGKVMVSISLLSSMYIYAPVKGWVAVDDMRV